MANYDLRVNYIVYVGMVMGPLSILGSLLILLTSYRTRRKGTTMNTYHRLLSGVAIADILLSAGLSLGPFPIPAEADFPSSASGTQATCSFQSFLLQVGFGSFAYSASLMIYYTLIVRFNLKEKTLTTYVEPILHAVPILFHISTGILGFVWEVFNPQSIYCWVGTWPMGCLEDDPSTCKRGAEYERTFGLYLTVVPFLIYSGIIVTCLLIVSLTVWQKYRATRSFEFDRSSGLTQKQKQMQLVVTQCILYGILFVNITIWGTCSTFMVLWGKREFKALDRHYWIAVIAHTLFPLQGILYFFVYIRPMRIHLRSLNRDLGFFQSFWKAIWDAEQPSSAPSRRSSPMNSGESYRVPVDQRDNSRRKQDPILDEISHFDAENFNEKQNSVGTTIESSAYLQGETEEIDFSHDHAIQ